MSDGSPVATWKPIPGWEGWYEISDLGELRSVTRTLTLSDGRVRTFYGKSISPGTAGHYGHQNANLHRCGRAVAVAIHRMVMLTFIGPPPSGMVVCHNNGDATDNRLSNLRYDTPRENTLDNVRLGTHHYSKRDACKWGHLLIGPNLRASRRQRVCLTCHNVRNLISKAKRRGSPLPDFAVTASAYYAGIMANYTPPVIPSQRSSDEVVATQT